MHDTSSHPGANKVMFTGALYTVTGKYVCLKQLASPYSSSFQSIHNHFLPFSFSNRLVKSSKSRSPSPPELPPLALGGLPEGTAGKLKSVGHGGRERSMGGGGWRGEEVVGEEWEGEEVGGGGGKGRRLEGGEGGEEVGGGRRLEGGGGKGRRLEGEEVEGGRWEGEEVGGGGGGTDDE